MRFIKLKEEERHELTKVYRTHSKSHVRQRAHCLLLSDKKHKVPELAKIFFTRTHTIRSWFNRWEEEGIKGLEIRPGRGLKPTIKMEDVDFVDSIKEEVRNDPHNLSKVVENLNTKWGTTLTVWQLKSFLKKKLNYKWRRFRECLKKCQDPHLYEYMVSQLCFYLMLEEAGKVKIYYGDESGFSLEPCIPYGWQPPEEYTRITPVGGQRLNVFGLLSRDNDLHAYTIEDTVDSDAVIAFMDDFVKKITMKTVVVLDNASIHCSKKFKSKLLEWTQKGLRIFHLPPYSPHLNLIETLWRKMKYEWLKPDDYMSWETLKTAIDNILCSVGKEYNIKFKELRHFTEYKENKSGVYLV
jgi:transposase